MGNRGELGMAEPISTMGGAFKTSANLMGICKPES